MREETIINIIKKIFFKLYNLPVEWGNMNDL